MDVTLIGGLLIILVILANRIVEDLQNRDN